MMWMEIVKFLGCFMCLYGVFIVMLIADAKRRKTGLTDIFIGFSTYLMVTTMLLMASAVIMTHVN